jgi:hypothetical protein
MPYIADNSSKKIPKGIVSKYQAKKQEKSNNCKQKNNLVAISKLFSKHDLTGLILSCR